MRPNYLKPLQHQQITTTITDVEGNLPTGLLLHIARCQATLPHGGSL